MILELFEKVFPLRNIEIKYSNKLPWVTTGLRISIKQKPILQNKFEKDPTEENKLLYKRHRNLLTSLMRNSERLYIMRINWNYKNMTYENLGKLLNKSLER